MPGFLRRFFGGSKKPKLAKQPPKGKAPRGAAQRRPVKETPEQAAERQRASGPEYTKVPLKEGGVASVKREYAVKELVERGPKEAAKKKSEEK